jgi:magnesium and cobalt transporter
VLEEIVGEIEDEFDEQEQENGIYTLADGSHRVAGDVSIGAVNEAFGTRLSEEDFDTIGGLVAQEHGRVPRRGETVAIGGLAFTVMIARGGAVRWFRVSRLPEAAEDSVLD